MQPIHVSVLALFRVCMQWAEEDIFDTVRWSKTLCFACFATFYNQASDNFPVTV